MSLISVFSKKSKETVEEMQPIKVMDNGAVRYPETERLPYAGWNAIGDYDRRLDGRIMNYLGSLGYIDDEYAVEAGLPRLKVICEYCRGKTDFHYYQIFCWYGDQFRFTYYYNCRRCGKKTVVTDRDQNKFERGVWK